MVFSRVEGENVVARASTRVSFPTYSPRRACLVRATCTASRACTRSPDRGGRCYRAYRIVAAVGVPGQYDGIQGRSWKSPPILDNPSTTTRMRRRTYELFYDGARLAQVAPRTSRASYWVSNTRSRTLINAQMLAIARSLTRVGER